MGACISTSVKGGAAMEKLMEGLFTSKDNGKKNVSTNDLSASQEKIKKELPTPSIADRQRIYRNSSSSSMASLHTKRGQNRNANQDAMVLWEGFLSIKDTIFGGVFDGHGTNGHLVARKVRDSLPSRVAFELQELLSRGICHTADGDLHSDVIPPNDCTSDFKSSNHELKAKIQEPEILITYWRDCLLKAYMMMDKELRVDPSLDCSCSGTTAATILKQDRHVLIANVGDSRAVLGTKAENGAIEAVQLTVDLKPNLPQEEERIRKCKGRVFALRDEPHVHRIWTPDESSHGLAMARALGDLDFKEFGLIAVPDISYRFLSDMDQFIVLATDGVWEVLDNTEVVNIVWKAQSRATAARDVVRCAGRSWKIRRPEFCADDCAVVCLFFEA